MPLKATLYKSSKETNGRTNLQFVESKLRELSASNKLTFNIVDTADKTENEMIDLYSRAVMPSVWKKYRIRKIFGTNRQSGIFFGREQPALLLEGDVWGIYPHEQDKKLVTIENFLENLADTME